MRYQNPQKLKQPCIAAIVESAAAVAAAVAATAVAFLLHVLTMLF